MRGGKSLYVCYLHVRTCTQGNTAAGGAVARRKSCPHRELPAIPGRSGRTQLPIGPEGPRNDLGVTRLNSSERSGQRGGCSSPQRRVVHPTPPLRVWDLCPRQRRVVRGASLAFVCSVYPKVLYTREYWPARALPHVFRHPSRTLECTPRSKARKLLLLLLLLECEGRTSS